MIIFGINGSDLISDSENISRKSLNLDLEPECLANWYVSKYTGNFNFFPYFIILFVFMFFLVKLKTAQY